MDSKQATTDRIPIEGYRPDEILRFLDSQFSELVFTGEPISLRVGSAEILVAFRKTSDTLTLELAHIDGGGEGVLPRLASLAEKYAVREGMRRIEWIVHALTCAKPNLKLKRVLERRGFVVEEVENIGKAYRLVRTLR